MIWLALLLATVPAGSLAEELVRVQRIPSAAGRLELVSKLRGEAPDDQAKGSLAYLEGDLDERLGRTKAASRAFGIVLASVPELKPYARYRLSRLELEAGHPEMAAGLAAQLIGEDLPTALTSSAARLFRAALDRGGDCRLLEGLTFDDLPTPERRSLVVARADCLRARGLAGEARDLLVDLLDESLADDAAREAAHRLVSSKGPGFPDRISRLLGSAFHRHREFELAIEYLDPLVDELPTEIRSEEDFELGYILARSHFWLGAHKRAAAAFRSLGERSVDPTGRAQAYYQEGRSWELAGDLISALSAFARGANVTPASAWTGAAILSALRIRWVRSEEPEALALYEVLQSRRRWADYAARGGLFMASTDLVDGRTDRAGTWLLAAARSGGGTSPEIDYWLGRWEEARGRLTGAVSHYAKVLRQLPHHPLAEDSRRRLTEGPVAEAARRQAAAWASSASLELKILSWLIEPERDERLTQILYQLFVRDNEIAPFLKIAAVEPARWPLWSGWPDDAEERLLGLGQWREVRMSTILDRFPVEEPDLAFTAAIELLRSGESRRAVYIAEVLARRVERRVPPEFLSAPFRRLLYPIPHREIVVEATGRHRIEPQLLYGIMREESRFDERALSGAAARGLTQFVIPTAIRVAASAGMGAIDPEDLYRPEVSIGLGAAYLAELRSRFDGRDHIAIAAYNAGEAQAGLWRSYCASEEAAEYYTKIGFRQTRAYVGRVLTSRSVYRQLYPGLGE